MQPKTQIVGSKQDCRMCIILYLEKTATRNSLEKDKATLHVISKSCEDTNNSNDVYLKLLQHETIT